MIERIMKGIRKMITLKFEKGTEDDIDELEELYSSTIDFFSQHINYPGWKKGIYPSRETATEGVKEGNLYVVRSGNRIVGTAILRHKPEVAYFQAEWHVNLDYSDVFVVYTFAVHPSFMKKGVGKSLMNFIVDYSQKEKAKAIRLDVYQNNAPAISLYKSCGFEYIDTVDLGYGQYGLDKFELYQMLL